MTTVDESTTESNHAVTTVAREPFTIVSNSMLNDPNLSWKAKGMLTWMISRPPGWNFNLSHMATVGDDGDSATRSGFKELTDQDYVRRSREQGPDGRILRHVVQVRGSKQIDFLPAEPDVDFPRVEPARVEDRPLVSKERVITEKQTPPSPPSDSSAEQTPKVRPPIQDTDATFAEIWERWTRKTGKGAAWKQWQKIRGRGETADVLTAVFHYADAHPTVRYCMSLERFLKRPDDEWRDWIDGNPLKAEVDYAQIVANALEDT